jgi:hypothetical protein
VTVELISSLLAVVIGGTLAIAGGYASTRLMEKHRLDQESRSLALAFKGEISALLLHMERRDYAGRFREVIGQIEATQQPFFMPFRIRFAYDSVYQENVARIGLLKGKLPELVPHFYTQLHSIMDDLISLGDRTYADLDLETLLRIYEDLARVLNETTSIGRAIILEVDRQYPKRE